MMGRPSNPDSDAILHLIKPNTVGAEIGVWMGNSSAKFLKKDIAELQLVDAWSVEPYKENSESTYEEYLSKYAKVTGGANERDFVDYYNWVHQGVVTRFSQDVRVKVNRQNSIDFFKEYKGNKFDWIYIDGDHSKEGCLADLEGCLQHMKKDGIILGDDYRWPFQNQGGKLNGKPGVTEAVDLFVAKHGFEKIQHGNIQYEIRIK